MAIRIGAWEISRVEEVLLPEASSLFSEWLPEMAAEHAGWMGRSFYDEEADAFVSSIHSWVLRRPGTTIVIDTCGGNDKPRPASPRFDHLRQPYLERLLAVGVRPEDVDLVINTHLHVDHVGWNTRLVDGAWVPTFPRARYLFPRLEVEVRDPARGAAGRPPATHLPFLDSVAPILEAGRAALLEGTEVVADGVRLLPVPGHAPGQMAVSVRSGGEEALFTADVMHQPVQVHRSAWNSRYCEDGETARATRRAVLEHAADHRSFLLPAHFGAPHHGLVTRTDDGFRFVPSSATPYAEAGRV